MAVGEDGRWRPGSAEDLRRESAGRPTFVAPRLIRWSSPVFALLAWVTVLIGWSRGRAWGEDLLGGYLVMACLWTVAAVAVWRPSVPRRARGGPAQPRT
ncbi:hypothetical protein [uncultured Serinicoccus sp.]|uniref:hypothetical protein n=1 Tax=uncultured Serinicoccus sp. TaxID=735514 RepID=UPI002619736A|nr:hypothetical protein [uncultured Serinicoccus sp.]